ncbi:MAG TPA: hypothetical protein P5089_02290 [Candidatus Portnoybacteria bacterium]|nr:hypothetical protein [Candidatus Portnoybacteria bacterium]
MKKYLTGFTDFSKHYYHGLVLKGKWGKIIFQKHKEPSNKYNIPGTPCYHLIIEATSEEKALEALDLVYACITILAGYDVVGIEDIYSWPGLKLIELKGQNAFPTVFLGGDVYLAGVMAARASFNDKFIYAIYKLFFSLRSYSRPIVDFEPGERLESPNLASPFPHRFRVMASGAINLAFSAIEELNLKIIPKDIIPGTEKPQSKDNKGTILPKTEQDILLRLKKAKIKTSITYDWAVRGGKRLIENKKPFIKKGNKSSWSAGSNVRDEEITLVQAIDRSSFLRSSVCAHSLSGKEKDTKKIIKTVSPYDIMNVQYLVRCLLLETLGIIKLKRI